MPTNNNKPDDLSAHSILDIKDINELDQLGKINGKNFTLVIADGITKRATIDTIAGYLAGLLGNVEGSGSGSIISSGRGNLHYIPEGEEIPLHKRDPGSFYLVEKSQRSIRSQISLPVSVKISKQLGLKRI